MACLEKRAEVMYRMEVSFSMTGRMDFLTLVDNKTCKDKSQGVTRIDEISAIDMLSFGNKASPS